MILLNAAREAWNRGYAMRARRERFKRFTYGDQWGDTVRTADGRYVSEGRLIEDQGRQPLTNNLIRRLVKTIVGRYRTLCTDKGRYDLSDTVTAVNELPELDSRLLEEFLISGVAVQRVAPDIRPSGAAVWVDNVSPRAFFTGEFADPRGNDVELVGMMHDMSPAQLMARFGGDSPARRQKLAAIYSRDDIATQGLTATDTQAADFLSPAVAGKCRVIELWTLDAVAGDTSAFRWQCRWLAPTGDVLAQYPSPWAHGRHPFIFRFYPYTDGEVHPFVEDVIDQQKYINRLIMLIDRMMGASAKGVLLFPLDQKTRDVTWREICQRWSAADGVIPITGKGAMLPQQVSGNGADAGAHRLLELELKLFEDVSGVSDAMLGRATSGNGGAGLYESQIQNSTAALADIFDTFNAFTARRDVLAASLKAPSPSKFKPSNQSKL